MKCAQSTMHDILHVPGKSSKLIPAINKALGWEQPSEIPHDKATRHSQVAMQAAAIFDQLPEPLRAAKLADLVATLAQINKNR
jgi:hypothetical protein